MRRDIAKHPYDNSVLYVEDSVSEYVCSGNDGLEYNTRPGYAYNGLTEANNIKDKAAATCVFSRFIKNVRVQLMLAVSASGF